MVHKSRVCWNNKTECKDASAPPIFGSDLPTSQFIPNPKSQVWKVPRTTGQTVGMVRSIICNVKTLFFRGSGQLREVETASNSTSRKWGGGGDKIFNCNSLALFSSVWASGTSIGVLHLKSVIMILQGQWNSRNEPVHSLSPLKRKGYLPKWQRTDVRHACRNTSQCRADKRSYICHPKIRVPFFVRSLNCNWETQTDQIRCIHYKKKTQTLFWTFLIFTLFCTCVYQFRNRSQIRINASHFQNQSNWAHFEVILPVLLLVHEIILPLPVQGNRCSKIINPNWMYWVSVLVN